GLPATAGFTGTATDLPFFDWTAVAYADSRDSVAHAGELLLADSTGAVTRYGVDQFRFAAAVPSSRLLYTGSSLLSASRSSRTFAVGFYGADVCDGASPSSLLPTVGGCAPPLLIASWNGASNGGVLAVDPAGNAFVAMQNETAAELRGFEASTIAAGTPPTEG